ncbi:MAG: hypothetical protein RMY16_28040 [Nostoc sp. DedQUE12b]|uniref:hypothetical protein n=1 Tax=Nostoc sp. DedQUE12b TaxID=3075398 RepID=UPI002AD3FDDC|nr:hypothetical protein [Nostoc sp. DedQUE12b]MDZ8089372.1 hypothetical protein [Nostoc sp. DedQUE12b]
MQNSNFYQELGYGLFIFIILATGGLFLYFVIRKSIIISEYTSSQLVFRTQPKLSQSIGIIMVGITLVFLLATLMLAPITKLNCSRLFQNASFFNQEKYTFQCELLEIGLFDNQVRTEVFSELNSVKIEAIDNENSHREITKTYQLFLSTDLGNIPFKNLSSYTKNHKLDKLYSIAASIKYFIENPSEKTLSVLQNDSDGVYAGFKITIFFGLLALLIIALGKVTDCKFDKETNTMTMSRHQWFGKLGKEVIQHSLNEIKDVKLEHIEGEEGGWLYRVTFVLKSDEIIPLTQVYSSVYQEKQQLVNCIKTFLQDKSGNGK